MLNFTNDIDSDPFFLLAKKHHRRIILAEGDDYRIQQAAAWITEHKIAEITLLFPNETSMQKATGLSSQIEKIVPLNDDRLAELSDLLFQKRKAKGMSHAAASEAASLPLNFAHLMLASGYVDGSVAGANNTTADTIRSALQIVGTLPSNQKNIGENLLQPKLPELTKKIVSSYFVMRFAGNQQIKPQTFLFADCSMVPDPNEFELAQIAVDTIQSANFILNDEPRVAMLSFSTELSAKHSEVEKVRNAAAHVKNLLPGAQVSNDIQFDAAVIAEVGSKKAPDSNVAGRANVFIFPNLASGNIGYKIAQRLGGAEAIGPIVQGLAKPANDLSRGCTVADICKTIALTAMQSIDMKQN